MNQSETKFFIGQIVHHKKFDYRGVIIDVDPVFMGTEEWYEEVARSRPPKDKPWYHVLVHNSIQQTYVAERHLEPDSLCEPIDHPLVHQLFSELREGVYVRKHNIN